MEQSQRRSRSGALGVASLVLAVLAGLGSATGAWIPGGFVGLVAAVLGFLGRRKAGAGGRAIVANLGLILGALVLLGSIVLVIGDPPE